MDSKIYTKMYADYLRRLVQDHGEARAMELVVGDTDHWVGVLEYGILLNLGLAHTDFIVDVGCGTGRLSNRLAKSGYAGRYIGTDILAEIVNFARQRTNRPQWSFQIASAPPLLEVPDGTADWVVFYSVFTHILDEDIYSYLLDAKRMLRPGGKVVFSFLEFSSLDHWPVFEKALAQREEVTPLNRFIDRGSMQVWCSKIGLKVEGFFDGNDPWIRLKPPLVEYELTAPFWQSVGVLSI